MVDSLGPSADAHAFREAELLNVMTHQPRKALGGQLSEARALDYVERRMCGLSVRERCSKSGNMLTGNCIYIVIFGYRETEQTEQVLQFRIPTGTTLHRFAGLQLLRHLGLS